MSLQHWSPWWRHHMETFPTLLALCTWNSPITGEFPSQSPGVRSFDVFVDLRLRRRLSKQTRRRCFQTPLRSLLQHCNACRISQLWDLPEESEHSHNNITSMRAQVNHPKTSSNGSWGLFNLPIYHLTKYKDHQSVTLWMCSTWAADWLQGVRRWSPPISGQFPEQSLKILLTCASLYGAGFSTGPLKRYNHSVTSHNLLPFRSMTYADFHFAYPLIALSYREYWFFWV